MADESNEQRTLEPTPRRRESARQAGQVARSSTLVGATALVAGLLAMRASGSAIASRLAELGVAQWSHTTTTASSATSMVGQLQHWLLLAVILAGPVLVVVPTAIIAIQVLQSGWLWLPQRLGWQPARLGLAAAVRRHGEAESLRDVLRNLAQVVVGLAAGGWHAGNAGPTLFAAGTRPPAQQTELLLLFVVDTALWAGGAWLLVGLADYAWAWRRLERQLHMTPQEAREEARSEQRARAK